MNWWPTDLWRQHLLDKTAPTDVDAISETVASVFDAIYDFGPSHIDLRSLDVDRVNAEHLVAVLRCTFNLRAEVPGWKAGLRAARYLLPKVDLEPDLVLKGLDQQP